MACAAVRANTHLRVLDVMAVVWCGAVWALRPYVRVCGEMDGWTDGWPGWAVRPWEGFSDVNLSACLLACVRSLPPCILKYSRGVIAVTRETVCSVGFDVSASPRHVPCGCGGCHV